MFDDVDNTLQKLLTTVFPSPLPFDLSFAVPDKNFRPVSGDKTTLSCYLYEIREDRELRSADPTLLRNSDGTIEKVYPPLRVRLAYCITAWSPVQPNPGLEPSVEEHRLLGQVLAQLVRFPTLPSEVLQGSLVGQMPPPPTTVVLPEDMRANRDFWNAVGGTLRPALDYSITISLSYQPSVKGPMMTTARLSVGGEPGSFLIGGTVRSSVSPGPVLPGVWVRVQETGQTEVTDQEGRFRISRLTPGGYTLLARAGGFQDGSRAVTVPQAGGGYDMTLNPL